MSSVVMDKSTGPRVRVDVDSFPAEVVQPSGRVPSPAARYGWAVVAIAAAFLLRLSIDPYLGDRLPFATYFFAILAVAWYGGFGPGLVTMLVGGLLSVYAFLPPRGSLVLDNAGDVAATLLYAATGFSIAILGGAIRTASRRAEDLGAVAHASLRSRDRELEQRRAAEEKLRETNDLLERRILERTAELAATSESLAAGEKKLSAIIDSAMDAILAFDEDLHIRVFNPAAERISGYSAEEMLGQPLQKLMPERQHQETADYIVEFAKSGLRGRRIEERGVLHALRADGSELPIEISLSRTTVGDRPLFTAIVRDLSERRRAEQELGRVNSQLATALEAGEMGTWTYAPETGVVEWDDANLRLWGRTRDELVPAVPETVFSFVHPEDRDFVRTQVEDATNSGHGLRLEHRVVLPGGGVRWHLARARRLPAMNGRPALFVGITVDITEKRGADEARAQAQKLEALGTLAGGIAHDFNNILMAIRGNAELAVSQVEEGHPALACLAEIAKAGDRARDLVRRILSFTRSGDPDFQVVSVRATLEDSIRMLRASLPAMVDLDTSIPDEDLRVRADPTQIQQVLVNLTTNAAHAIGGHGHIHFRVGTETLESNRDPALAGLPDGDYVRIEVRDDGCGMDVTTMGRIFDPFFTTKGAGEGTGLGLSVVHGIVKSHGGGIVVKSRPGEGATFSIYLPVANEALSPPPVIQAPAAHAGGERILYVDDEPSLVMLATHSLGKLGYRVSGFEVPELALRAFLTRPDDFDVVVTDLSMPHMSGFELARAILAERPDLPIVLVSGYVRPEEEETAKQIGIRKVLLKPDTVEQLGRAITSVLAGPDVKPG